MNQAKISELKKAAAKAFAAHEAEKARLIAAGIKSNARYELLKDLKSASDAAHAESLKFSTGQIKKELNRIIAEDIPARQAAARARSPWKQAKYEAMMKNK